MGATESLLRFSRKGNLQEVERWLNEGAKVNDCDYNGITSLGWAAKGDHLDIVERLLIAGADPNIVDKKGMSPLLFAVSNGHARTVERLLNAGAAIDVVCVDGWTPLTLAAQGGHISILDFLLVAGAKVNCVTTNGTALSAAAKSGHLEVVEALLNARATVDLGNSDGSTPLHEAIIISNATIVTRLLAAGADVNRPSDVGLTPLHVAAIVGDVGILEHLLAAGARVNDNINGSGTALCVAGSEGHLEFVKRLLVAGAELEGADGSGSTALIQSAKNGHELVVAKLIEVGATLDTKDDEGSALTCATMNGHVKVACVLLDAGADPLSRHCNGLTASEIFQANGNAEMAALVRDFQPSASTYFIALQRGNMGVAKRLARASASFRAENNRTPLHVAAMLGRFAAVKALVEGGAALSARDDTGWTPLHFACGKGDVNSALFLVDSGALTSAVDDLGRTPVNVAASNGHLELVRALADRGASLQTTSTGVEEGRTILHHAVWGNSKPLLEYLLEQGVVNVNSVDPHGSPLHHAVHALANVPVASSSSDESESRMAVLRTLLKTPGVDINVRNSSGKTPLFIGSERDDARSVRALLDAGARTDIPDNSGKTPLEIATSSDIRAVVELFQKSQQFHEKCLTLLNIQDATPVETTELQALVPLITSVHDLRLMLTVCTVHPKVARDSAVLKAAFDHVVASKLTFDDEACVFFKLMLEHCEHGRLITRGDFLLLDRRAEKANTESAEWVIELKRHVHTNSWRLDAHERQMAAITDNVSHVHSLVMENRANIDQIATHLANFQQAYASRLEQEEKAKRIKLVCGVLAAVGGFVIADVLANCTQEVVDFADPSDIVEKVLNSKDLGEFLKDTTKTYVNDTLKERLETFAIPQDKFEDLLRVGLVLTHPELIPADTIPAARDDHNVEPQMQRLNIEPQTHGARNVLLAEAPRHESVIASSELSGEAQLCDPERFPCHDAVQRSLGDAAIFQQLIDGIVGDIDADAVAQVCLNESTTSQEALCAAQYAYLLGYTDIGDAISADMDNHLPFDKTPATSVDLVGEIDENPFIYAVHESEGSTQAYDDLLCVLDIDAHAIEDTTEALVVRGTCQEVAWTVVEFASHLGYVDVVKHLFKDVCRSIPAKARVLSMKQARERAKVLSDRSLVSSVTTAA